MADPYSCLIGLTPTSYFVANCTSVAESELDSMISILLTNGMRAAANSTSSASSATASEVAGACNDSCVAPEVELAQYKQAFRSLLRSVVQWSILPDPTDVYHSVQRYVAMQRGISSLPSGTVVIVNLAEAIDEALEQHQQQPLPPPPPLPQAEATSLDQQQPPQSQQQQQLPCTVTQLYQHLLQPLPSCFECATESVCDTPSPTIISDSKRDGLVFGRIVTNRMFSGSRVSVCIDPSERQPLVFPIQAIIPVSASAIATCQFDTLESLLHLPVHDLIAMLTHYCKQVHNMMYSVVPSTNITQHQPTSPNINQHHPTSPNITQHHPTSPNITIATTIMCVTHSVYHWA
jgi:hypothetical protein